MLEVGQHYRKFGKEYLYTYKCFNEDCNKLQNYDYLTETVKN